MNLIDVTIVNVALPSMREGSGATDSQIEWVIAAYVLAFALGLLPFGRLGDIVGRTHMFLWGVAGFTAASALCGLSPNIEFLIIARVIRGTAGAMMTPQVLAIATVTFPRMSAAEPSRCSAFRRGSLQYAAPFWVAC
ncbi:MFS transporter [Devosia sp. A8/3-2]|nr:MFS transporter [Devosia sp. A8/3-2]